ncbi:hypothetical protein [Sediminibacter sp. Hel_I_10]|uniref:hypothetical protein n=1 Tax=Sediminibacter sp. Hel_I_10 TaxID=1392490 RepID=UPI00047B4E55|nr:hypothetical protein [Sediminibacter sp. Hel_I_10]
MPIDTLLNNDVTVIIRSSKERSIEVCLNSVLKEIDKTNVFLIEEVPFIKAVQKTFEIGLAENRKWTLAIDADLLLLPHSISIMVNQAQLKSEKLYVYQGFILDKFRCGIRQGGPHLYKTEHLKTALDLIDNEGNNLRPESAIYNQMIKRGYDVIVEKKIFALHDFEQNYKDIYRKAYFHGIKHKGWRSLLASWLEKSATDHDYKIASSGFLDGYFSDKRQYPSPEEFDQKTIELLQKKFNIKEKPALASVKNEFTEEILNSYGINYSKDLDLIPKKKPLIAKIKSKFFQ